MAYKLHVRLAALEPAFSPLAYKATLIGMLAAAVAIPLALAAIPYLNIFNDMAVQPKGKAQSLYGAVADQSLIVDRMPAAGSVPISYGGYPLEGKDPKTAELAGKMFKNPLRPTMAVLKRGQKIFHDICRTCHGVEAQGDGPIVGPGLFPAPPSLHTLAAREFKDGHIFHVITRGQNAMPSYADKLSVTDRWSVIHFVRALQRSLHPTPKDLTQLEDRKE
jgi:hypothetical protein